jgi:hypothetical protein
MDSICVRSRKLQKAVWAHVLLNSTPLQLTLGFAQSFVGVSPGRLEWRFHVHICSVVDNLCASCG